MSDIQQQALATFTTMLQRAIAYRANPQENDQSTFYTGYGICDNISRCMPDSAREERMSLVKDNIIRRLPSYSGNYHYPVKHPNPKPNVTQSQAGDMAWSEFSNKWEGAYGAERLQQLMELVDVIRDKWDNKYGERMTPATRVGIIPNVTIVRHVDNGDLYTLVSDDDSTDPYFLQVGKNMDQRRSIDLRNVEILPMQEVGKRSVKSFINQIKKAAEKRAKLEAQIAELNKQRQLLISQEAVLDYHLGEQHSVKRLAA